MSDFILIPVEDEGCCGPIASGCCLVGCAILFLGGMCGCAATGIGILKSAQTICKRRLRSGK